jgi:GTP cyclohydrolase I
MSATSTYAKQLEALPEELLQHIVEHLDGRGLAVFSLAAKWCYELASSVRWREVVLTDCLRVHPSELDENGNEIERIDDHDDTPLLKKLAVLAT